MTTRMLTSAQMTPAETRKFAIHLLDITMAGELTGLDRWLESAKVAPGDVFWPGFGRAIGVFYDGRTRKYEVRLTLDTGGDGD